jgi:hypothetical protein
MDDATLDRIFFGTETIESLDRDIWMLMSIKPTTELEKKLIALILKGKFHLLEDARRRKAA